MSKVSASPPVSVTVPVLTAVVDQFARMITGAGPANAALGLYLDHWQRDRPYGA